MKEKELGIGKREMIHWATDMIHGATDRHSMRLLFLVLEGYDILFIRSESPLQRVLVHGIASTPSGGLSHGFAPLFGTRPWNRSVQRGRKQGTTYSL